MNLEKVGCPIQFDFIFNVILATILLWSEYYVLFAQQPAIVKFNSYPFDQQRFWLPGTR